MTIKELIEKLRTFSPDTPVVIHDHSNGGYRRIMYALPVALVEKPRGWIVRAEDYKRNEYDPGSRDEKPIDGLVIG